jgi:hypothetical protein
MHPQYSPQDEEDEEFDAMPDELKDHMWAAFAHKAGVGPHPGIYKGPKAKQPKVEAKPVKRKAKPVKPFESMHLPKKRRKAS